MSLETIKKVDDILDAADVPERHTFFQMKNFIVGKECTIQGQLWQVVRELRSRRESLEALEDQIADLEDNVELATIDIDRMRQIKSSEADNLAPEEIRNLQDKEAKIRIRKAERELRSLYRNINRLKNKAKYLSEEITYLVGAYEVLVKAEPLKPIDDIDSQRKYWNEKFMEELNLRLLLKQPLDPDFVRTVMTLDDDSPVKVQMMTILQNVQNYMLAERDRQRAAQSQIAAIQERGAVKDNV